MKYSFNHAGPYVDIPALDAFLHEFRAVCKKYEVGFRLNSPYGGFPFLQMVPIERCDWDVFTESLGASAMGVAFLDEARKRWDAAVAKLAKEEEQRRADQLRRTAEHQAQREADLKENGLTLSDGHYKLVKNA